MHWYHNKAKNIEIIRTIYRDFKYLFNILVNTLGNLVNTKESKKSESQDHIYLLISSMRNKNRIKTYWYIQNRNKLQIYQF